MDLKAAIAKAKAETETAEQDIDIVVGDELVKVVFKRLPGWAWADVLAKHPPRPGSDGTIGYNPDAAVRDYPVDHIRVNGEPVDEDTWAEMFAVVTSPNIKFMAAAIYGLNQVAPLDRIAELGKARTSVPSKKRTSRAK